MVEVLPEMSSSSAPQNTCEHQAPAGLCAALWAWAPPLLPFRLQKLPADSWICSTPGCQTVEISGCVFSLLALPLLVNQPPLRHKTALREVDSKHKEPHLLSSPYHGPASRTSWASKLYLKWWTVQESPFLGKQACNKSAASGSAMCSDGGYQLPRCRLAEMRLKRYGASTGKSCWHCCLWRLSFSRWHCHIDWVIGKDDVQIIFLQTMYGFL